STVAPRESPDAGALCPTLLFLHSLGHFRTSTVAGSEPFERQDVIWERPLVSHFAVHVRARAAMAQNIG
ncbi:MULTISPECIES: hypothetical protein, partial [unclassified Burkholderia]|uniref:hypothetical protein n=1 Tax=unclassified Burkholderia TaxID=2613784 RepID=UPI001C54F69A